MPSVGSAVYDVRAADRASPMLNGLKVTQSSLENDRYQVKLDEHGDVSSIFDKKVNHELLSAAIRLAVLTDNSRVYPAWHMDFEDEQRPPRRFIGGAARVRVVENGPVRV